MLTKQTATTHFHPQSLASSVRVSAHLSNWSPKLEHPNQPSNHWNTIEFGYNLQSNMKKIFSKFDKNEKIESSGGGGSHHRETGSYVGKVFTVGRTVVTVEDILAEG